MSDWCDSVPFIKEIGDRSQLSRAGIAKTTTDAKINAGDNNDAAGVSPVGFVTFVRPAQIPLLLDSASIVWSKVPRGGSTNTDTGGGVEDWSAAVQFPPNPQETTITVELHDNYTTRYVKGTYPCSVIESSTVTPAGEPLNTQLQVLENAIHSANEMIINLANSICNMQDATVAVGDIVLSITGPGGWGTKYLEPKGQSLLRADYPALFTIFGTTYGAADILHFNLPDMVTGQNYLRVKESVGLLPLALVTGGTNQRILDDPDMPDHSHTLVGAATSTNGEHTHTFQVHKSDLGYTVVDGNGGDPDFNNYTTPTGGDHYHDVDGGTTTYGNIAPDPVWDMNTSVTPRFANVYLKMRVL
jgi:microcystin-dependent protein